MARNNYSVGLLLIFIAIVLLLGKLGVFHFLGHLFWPFLILIPGLLFHFLYFNRMMPVGVLVPGGILITYSLMFFYCNLFGWDSMSYLWPGFILGVAVGLYEVHLFDRHSPKGVWVASMILAAISAIFFAFTLLYAVGVYFIAIVLLVAGVWMMMSRRVRPW